MLLSCRGKDWYFTQSAHHCICSFFSSFSQMHNLPTAPFHSLCDHSYIRWWRRWLQGCTCGTSVRSTDILSPLLYVRSPATLIERTCVYIELLLNWGEKNAEFMVITFLLTRRECCTLGPEGIEHLPRFCDKSRGSSWRVWVVDIGVSGIYIRIKTLLLRPQTVLWLIC